MDFFSFFGSKRGLAIRSGEEAKPGDGVYSQWKLLDACRDDALLSRRRSCGVAPDGAAGGQVGKRDPLFDSRMHIRKCMRRLNGTRQAYCALLESTRTARGPRQRIVAWLGRLDQHRRLGIEQSAQMDRGKNPSGDQQRSLFGEEFPVRKLQRIQSGFLTAGLSVMLRQSLLQPLRHALAPGECSRSPRRR